MYIKDLCYNNLEKEDYCEISKLIPNWKNILSKYMRNHYLRAIKYEVHHYYFVSIDICDDTISMLDSIKCTIYSIEYIVNCVMIKFLDEKSRNLFFDVLKGEVA